VHLAVEENEDLISYLSPILVQENIVQCIRSSNVDAIVFFHRIERLMRITNQEFGGDEPDLTTGCGSIRTTVDDLAPSEAGHGTFHFDAVFSHQ
jgi:hypothetical protein